MFNVKRILVPVDYSEISRAAISAAVKLAGAYNAELWLMHIQPGLDRKLQRRIQTHPHENNLSESIEKEEQSLVDALELEYKRAETAGEPLARVPVHLHISGGDWMEVANQLVDELELDLIVTGTHGPKGVAGLLWGSVSQQLVGKVTCSVMVVKPQGYPYLRD